MVREFLEAAACDWADKVHGLDRPLDATKVAKVSQAISLKRIADALELLAKPDPLADLNWQDWTPTEDQPKPLIPPGLQVAICARGGWKAAISLERTAALDWSHSNNPGDIVAYAIMPG